MEKYGKDYVIVGCSDSPKDDLFNDGDGLETLKKWLVDVRCPGCLGLYYRSAPNVIVPDADWPRNGDVVVASEIPDIPGTCVRFRIIPCRAGSSVLLIHHEPYFYHRVD